MISAARPCELLQGEKGGQFLFGSTCSGLPWMVPGPRSGSAEAVPRGGRVDN